MEQSRNGGPCMDRFELSHKSLNIIRKTADTASSEQKTKLNKHRPIVEFGRVDGYDNPQVVHCLTVEVDVGHRNQKSCKG
jgi:hypothetical protein